MPYTAPLDRTLALTYQKAFGGLRGLLRRQPVAVPDVLAQARECGRAAHAAMMRLDTLVELLVGLPMPDSHQTRSLPEDMIDAAIEGYLAAAAPLSVGADA